MGNIRFDELLTLDVIPELPVKRHCPRLSMAPHKSNASGPGNGFQLRHDHPARTASPCLRKHGNPAHLAASTKIYSPSPDGLALIVYNHMPAYGISIIIFSLDRDPLLLHENGISHLPNITRRFPVVNFMDSHSEFSGIYPVSRQR